jgi:hypothetical protein
VGLTFFCASSNAQAMEQKMNEANPHELTMPYEFFRCWARAVEGGTWPFSRM